MATERQLKADLRSRIKAALSHLSASEIESQSVAAQNVILSLPEYKAAERIGVYLCMPNGEAQTYKIVRRAFEDGKAVFVPHIHADQAPAEPQGSDSKPAKKRKVMSMLRLEDLQEYTNLKPDNWGIPTLPPAGLNERENAAGGLGLGGPADMQDVGGLDLVVMPGVAFDVKMNRTGHGAGYYDKFLANFCGNNSPRRKPYLGTSTQFSRDALFTNAMRP